ncbi:hypothetical protein P7H20_00960 [Paenibacillus larvae]|nr:hypothetical protein [Paenibacillus larvae]MDT2273737.1 hypothetical protein [Paenibacillus larvae]
MFQIRITIRLETPIQIWKASGAFDRTIHKAARDPLAAAYPSIAAGMEELVLQIIKILVDRGKDR